ncbi:multidrug efflux pump [Catalinimonas alkaloidigena]|uniref:Multidrug efflux pump n=1 Tax=Catalinimonas alkaloidigena TaxID=1075417 RepID=A0A1G9E4G1_9BACT|nr:efflux RND transporter permease subunit [Catalinimonas alkaloidigena]SDK71009.1 multidrug efflux pump [Catalinimonas alkaloidigena]
MADLSSLSIQRPVLAVVMSLVIMLFGVIGFYYLGVREYPSVDPPIVTVSTSYTGANADIVETQITEPLEEEINGIAGVRSLTSTSRDGRSTITVEFTLDSDLEAAANDVRDRVSRAVRSLPPEADPPTVSKADADAGAIIFLNVHSPKRSLLELSDIADKIFKERLQTIPGVSEIQIWGEKRYSMRLWIDPLRLAAYRLTPLDILTALQRENVELPSGRVEGQSTELSVRTMGRLRDVDAFNNLIIRQEGDRVVRFKDIGTAELGPENERTIMKRDGVPMVGVSLVPQPGSNQIEIADAFYARVEQIQKDLPDDIKTGVGFDNTTYIRESVREVEQTIFVAFMLVVFIIYLFLRDWRSTLIPVLTIPISLVGTFFLMWLLGFSINVLSLLGIVLAIGLVVDDTIVVLENIYTKIEEGVDPVTAGREGTKEIFLAVIATTVALVAVFLPVVFLQGITGRLFREFGLVIAGAVVISSFVALTLTPMASVRLLKKRVQQPWFYRKTEPFFQRLTDAYRASLESFMQMRWMAFVIMGISIGFIYLFFKILPRELSPLEDRNGFTVRATGPEGATFEFMDQYINSLIDLVETEVGDGLNAIISITSPGFGGSSSTNTGFLRVRLKDAEDREISQQEIVDNLTPKLTQLPRARAYVSQDPTISSNRRNSFPVQFVLQAPTIDDLKEILPAFEERARQDPHFSFVDINLKFTKPEIQIDIDRNKARTMGVNVNDIAQTLQLGLSGQRFGYYVMNGKQYQIIGQVGRENRNEPLDLRSLYVRSNNDNLVQMDNLVTLTEQSTPPQLYRFNRYAAATVQAQLAKGVTLGAGLEAMDKIADEVLPESFSTALDGDSREFMESSSSLAFAFVLALVLIYLVLSAQFESFRDPFVIMFTVPLALVGALLSLWYFDQTLNIFSQIGIIMLIGLVTKNGILIVEFAQQRREAGRSITEAIQDAATARFRPILMTSLSTILGILPIALALGAGSESRVSMGIAVVGGMIFATGLSLYVIPAIYTYLTSRSVRAAQAV